MTASFEKTQPNSLFPGCVARHFLEVKGIKDIDVYRMTGKALISNNILG